MNASSTPSRLPLIRGPRGLLLAALVASTLMAGGSLTKRQPVARLVSVTAEGKAADAHSLNGSASFNGRFVSFTSVASDLVDEPTNGQQGHYLHDRKQGTMRLVTLLPADPLGFGIEETNAQISGNGRVLVFDAQDLESVDGDTNGTVDVFVYDVRKDSLERISLLPDGSQASGLSALPSVSTSGRFVTFLSTAALSADDSNGSLDCYVHDRRTGKNTRLELDLQAITHPRISGNGRFVILSTLDALVPEDTDTFGDVYVHDRKKGTTTLASPGADEADCGQESISANGRFVAFQSTSSTLVDGDDNNQSDIFVYDTRRGITERVSVSSDGTEATGDSVRPRISANGRFVTFNSLASNLVDNDTNGLSDVFLHDRKTGTTVCLSVDADGVPQGGGFEAELGKSGRFVTMSSSAPLVDADENGRVDVYLLEPGKRRP